MSRRRNFSRPTGYSIIRGLAAAALAPAQEAPPALAYHGAANQSASRSKLAKVAAWSATCSALG